MLIGLILGAVVVIVPTIVLPVLYRRLADAEKRRMRDHIRRTTGNP
jgi:hypothetical protein